MAEFIIVSGVIWGFRFLIEKNHHSRVFIFLTGIIGTPIHELGHYLMCKLVGFKVTSVKLFRMPTADNPVMGYVEYQHPLTITGSIRKVVVSIGPIFTGFAALYWFSGQVTPYLLNPHTQAIDVLQFIEYASVKQWVYLWALCSITLHMLPSATDIKIATAGSLWISVLTYIGFIYAATHTAFLLKKAELYLYQMAKVMEIGATIAAPAVSLAVFLNIFSIFKSRVYNKSR